MQVVLQTESSECGLACLAMMASHFGHHQDFAALRRRYSISLKGANLIQMMRHAASMQMATRPLRLELDELSQLQTPCVLHWNLSHFVILLRVRKNLLGKGSIQIVDPAVGKRTVSLNEVSRSFTGVAVEFSPMAAFERHVPPARPSIRKLIGPISGLRRALIQVLALASALEIFALAAPLLNQFIIDEVIVGGDAELLSIVAIGFALILMTQTFLGAVRSWVLLRWSLEIGIQWGARVFTHLTRLPVSFFEKRHLGDVLSKFGGIATIQQTLTGLLAESLLDGIMALLSLGMMALYSPMLAGLVVGGVITYALLRWAFFGPLKDAAHERLLFSARENSNLVETLRAITPLKLFGRETERCAQWQNLKQAVNSRDEKVQQLGILFRSANTGLSAALTLAVLYLGARLVIQNALTVGMLMAFLSYSATFVARMNGLVEMFVSCKMLGLQADRLADIMLEQPEAGSETDVDLSAISPSLTLKNVKFRYADGEPWVLDGVSLHIPASQSLALVGPSGGGKTTLCKIILGLLEPTQGEVLIGGIPIKQLGIHAYRRLLGTVMQEDVLLTGSILENIAFFDSHPDVEFAKLCSQHAGIHSEICAMPMGYQTLLGDMGSSLSGGQKQRVLLARALYKNPRVMVLDEATSHLDLANERNVTASLSGMEITRIMVAHRPQTINAADRVVALENGALIEVRSVPLTNQAVHISA